MPSAVVHSCIQMPHALNYLENLTIKITALYAGRKAVKHSNSPTASDLTKLTHAHQVRFACYCARQVLHLVKLEDNQVAEKAITTAEAWLVGEATQEQCRQAAAAAAHASAHAAYAAADAAYTAASASAHAAYVATYAGANAAGAAAHAAYATAAYAAAATDKAELIKEQWEAYEDLLHFDKNFEEIVLRWRPNK